VTSGRSQTPSSQKQTKGRGIERERKTKGINGKRGKNQVKTALRYQSPQWNKQRKKYISSQHTPPLADPKILSEVAER
jgi:hypothetical protein